MVDFESQFKKESRALMIFFGCLGLFALLAMGIIVLGTFSKPKPCIQEAQPQRADVLEYKTMICQFAQDVQNYACIPVVLNGRDPACDTNPPTKFCADKGTSFTPNIGALKIK